MAITWKSFLPLSFPLQPHARMEKREMRKALMFAQNKIEIRCVFRHLSTFENKSLHETIAARPIGLLWELAWSSANYTCEHPRKLSHQCWRIVCFHGINQTEMIICSVIRTGEAAPNPSAESFIFLISHLEDASIETMRKWDEDNTVACRRCFFLELMNQIRQQAESRESVAIALDINWCAGVWGISTTSFVSRPETLLNISQWISHYEF